MKYKEIQTENLSVNIINNNNDNNCPCVCHEFDSVTVLLLHFSPPAKLQFQPKQAVISHCII